MIRWKTSALFLGAVLGTSALVSAAEADWEHPGAPYHGCAEACHCAPVCKSCILVPDVLKIVKPVHTCKELDFCLTRRSLRDLFRGHCGDGCSCGGCGGCGHGCDCPPCACPQCECRVRAKHVLLKKLVTIECPTFKCEPVCTPAPSCAAGGCCAGAETMEPAAVEQPKKPAPPVPPSAWLWRRAPSTSE
jgi:hypothetical protein